MVGIYKIISPTNKIYVGQSWNITKRWTYHRRDASKQPKLFASLKKHGVDNHKFEIVHELPNDVAQEVLNTYEQLYMDAYRDCGIELLNVKEAGNAGKLTDEARQLRSGRKCPESTKEKISNSLKGQIFSHDRKRNISKARTGNSLTKEHRQKISEGIKGIVRTAEHNEKLALTRIGKKHSAESIRKMREVKIGKRCGEENASSKVTEIQVKEIRSKWKPREYSSVKLAKEYGLSKTNILDIVHRRIWSHVA